MSHQFTLDNIIQKIINSKKVCINYNRYCTTPRVFLDRKQQSWGVKTFRSIVPGCLYMYSDALCGFFDLFFASVTLSTNSPLQFGWLCLDTEVSSVLFESKLENV